MEPHPLFRRLADPPLDDVIEHLRACRDVYIAVAGAWQIQLRLQLQPVSAIGQADTARRIDFGVELARLGWAVQPGTVFAVDGAEQRNGLRVTTSRLDRATAKTFGTALAGAVGQG